MDDCSPLPLRFRRKKTSTCKQSETSSGRIAPSARTAAPWRPAGSQKPAGQRSSRPDSTASANQSSRPSSRGPLQDCTHTINLQAPGLSSSSSYRSQLSLGSQRSSSQNAGSKPSSRCSSVAPAAAATHRQRAVCLQLPSHAPSSRYQMPPVRTSGAGHIFKAGASRTQHVQDHPVQQQQARVEQHVDVDLCVYTHRHSIQQDVDAAQQQQQDHQIMLLQRQLADLCLQQQAVLQKYAAACAPCPTAPEAGAAAAGGSPDVEPRRGLVLLPMQRRAGLASLERGSSPVAPSPAVVRSQARPGGHARDNSSGSSWTVAQLQMEAEATQAPLSSSSSDSGSMASPLSTPRTPAATSPELLVAQASHSSPPEQQGVLAAIGPALVAAPAGGDAAEQAPPADIDAIGDGGSSESCSEAWHPLPSLRHTLRPAGPTHDPLQQATTQPFTQARAGSGSDTGSQAPTPRCSQVYSSAAQGSTAAPAGISLRRSTTLRAAVARALQVRQAGAPQCQGAARPSSEAPLGQAAISVQGPGAMGAHVAAAEQQGLLGGTTSAAEPGGVSVGVGWRQGAANSSSISTSMRAMPATAAGLRQTAATGLALQQAGPSTSTPSTASSTPTAAAGAVGSRRAAVLRTPAAGCVAPSGSPQGSGGCRPPHYLAGLAHLRAQQDAAFQAMQAYHLQRGAAGRWGSSTSGSGHSSACSSGASTPKAGAAGAHYGGVAASSLAWVAHGSSASGTWADAGVLAAAAVRASPTTFTCSRLRPPPPPRSIRTAAERRPSSPGRLGALPDSQALASKAVGQEGTPEQPPVAASSGSSLAGRMSSPSPRGRLSSSSSRTMTEFMLDVQAARSPAGPGSVQQGAQHTPRSNRGLAVVCPGVAAAQRNLAGVLRVAAGHTSRSSSTPVQGDLQHDSSSSTASTSSSVSSSPGSPASSSSSDNNDASSPHCSPLRPLQLSAALLDEDLLRGAEQHSASPWQVKGAGWVVHTNWAAIAAEGAPPTATATGWQPMTAGP